MESITSFISELASYYWHENDLSNITVALCNSNVTFKTLFVKFFFPDIEVSEIDEICREVPDEGNHGSRVDIFISMRNESTPYLIEVKIGDENHHFGQYEEAYAIPPDRLGYIVNYRLYKPGYDIKTWEEFYKHLASLAGSLEDYDQPVIKGYLQYLQSVCQIEIFEKAMDLNGVYYLYEFSNIALNALSYKSENFSSEPYKQYQPVKSKKILGINVIDFYLSYNDKRKKSIYGWMSLYYNKEQPELYIAITERDNKSSHPLLFDNKKQRAGKTYLKPYEGLDEAWNMNCLWFQYKDIDKFNNCQDIQEQREMLCNYVKEVFEYVANS